MHNFEAQNSRQTLAEGVAEYYASNLGLVKRCGLSPAAQQFFRNHDTVHVVYGCGTSLSDEAIVKLSSIFGTTGGFSVLRGYQLYESRQIYKKLGIIEILLTILRSGILIPRTIFRCLRQHKYWPWDSCDNYLHVPLAEVRQEFGIRVAHGITPR
ncbi:MAG: hypothetical protein Dbin4_02742 [Alphaproteobacteria bacterium]|nr:hypothetical protein [Alphaproteobacteria bacterium]